LVQCPECGNRFDAALMGFCSRCGATAPAAGSTAARGWAPVAPVARNDPVRRRVQVGGMLLTTLGALGLAFCLGVLVVAGSGLEDTLGKVLQSQGDSAVAGGTLRVHVLDQGQAANATVELATPSGHALGTNQTAQGWANLTLGQHAIVNVTVTAGSHSLHRHAFVQAGSEQTLTLDVAHDVADDPAWIGLGELIGLLRIAVLVVAVASLALLAGGIAALAVRWAPLAIAGPIPAAALVILLTVATVNVGPLVVLLLLGAGLGLVVSGRRAFRRA
jgi:hypothetical protein